MLVSSAIGLQTICGLGGEGGSLEGIIAGLEV